METNNLYDVTTEAERKARSAAPLVFVDWTDPDLAKITRLRLVSDPGFPVWDVSYCHGVLHDGTFVRVRLPFHQLPKNGIMQGIVNAARRDGVFAKRLGTFDAVSTCQT